MGSEPGERFATLETQMKSILDAFSRREDQISEVLRAVIRIEIRGEDTLQYQKTCDAERKATDVRVKDLEDARKLEVGYRKILRAQVAMIGGVAAFIVSVISVVVGRHQ